VLKYPDAKTRPLFQSAIARAHPATDVPRKDEGLPVHDRRISLRLGLGLRCSAAMATGDAGHGLGDRGRRTTRRVRCRQARPLRLPGALQVDHGLRLIQRGLVQASGSLDGVCGASELTPRRRMQYAVHSPLLQYHHCRVLHMTCAEQASRRSLP
jgi:hypothetical protein